MQYLKTFEQYNNEQLNEGLGGWINRNAAAISTGYLAFIGSSYLQDNRNERGELKDTTLLFLTSLIIGIGGGVLGHQIDKSINLRSLIRKSNIDVGEIDKITVMLKKDPVVQQQIVNITNANSNDEKIAIVKEFEKHLAKNYNIKINK